MENKSEVFLFASDEIEELLADNAIDVADLLKNEGIAIERTFASDPATNVEAGLKEPVTVILASAALVLALTPILSRVLTSLTHKSIIVEELVLMPVEDSKGNIVYDDVGKPMVQWVNRTRFIESSEKRLPGNTVSIEGPLGIKLSFTDAPQR